MHLLLCQAFAHLSGHSAGLDFETRLYAKRNAAALLRYELSKPDYRCEPIAIGVNTDAYQPLEKQLHITREVLEILLEANHPAYLITKSSLIERDLDLLTELAQRNLVSVCITITTLDRKLARNLEPRATTPARRLQTLSRLSECGIPTRVSVSPVIPALNEAEIDSIVESAANAEAQAAYAIVLRLPHELQQLFPQWLKQHYPLRAARVMKAIRSVRENKLNNAIDGVFSSKSNGDLRFHRVNAPSFVTVSCSTTMLRNLEPYSKNRIFTTTDIYQEKKCLMMANYQFLTFKSSFEIAQNVRVPRRKTVGL